MQINVLSILSQGPQFFMMLIFKVLRSLRFFFAFLAVKPSYRYSTH